MSLDFEFDLEGKTEEEIDSGGKIKPGWHHAKIKDVSNDDANDAIAIKYEVQRGPSRGVVMFDRLFNGDPTDETKVMKAKQRQAMFAKRIGIMDRTTGKAKGSWLDAIGREVFIVVEAKEGRDKNTGKPNGQEFHNLKYDGIYALDDPRVPESVKQTGYGVDDLKPNKVEKATAGAAPPLSTSPIYGDGGQTAAHAAPPGANGNGGSGSTVPAPAATGRRDVDLSTI